MNKKGILCLAVIIKLLAVIVVVTFMNPSLRLHNAIKSFINTFGAEVPEGASLTIYYMEPWFLTRAPVDTDQIKEYSNTKVIAVPYDELVAHQTVFSKLAAASFTIIKDDYYTDARLYYVFASDNGRKMLGVTVNAGGDDTAEINGIPVKFHPILLEIIEPFLTADARYMFEID